MRSGRHPDGSLLLQVTSRPSLLLGARRGRVDVALEHHKLDTRSTIGGQELREPQRVMQMQLQRRPSGLPDWLYVAIVAALGLYFIIGAIAWTTFIYNGTPVPDSFTTILATIAGGLVGVLAPTGGPARSSQPNREQRPPAE